MRRAVFLDRDGTLIEEVGYLDRLDRLEFYPYSVDAVRLLNRAGFAVILVTNQSGVARGFFDEPFVNDAHREIQKRLAEGGARLDGVYYCPHHPDAKVEAYRQNCDCRKPLPGLLRRAAVDCGLDLPQSFVVGDRAHDVETGLAVGARAILVRTGYGSKAAATVSEQAVIADNLISAVSWILQQP